MADLSLNLVPRHTKGLTGYFLLIKQPTRSILPMLGQSGLHTRSVPFLCTGMKKQIPGHEWGWGGCCAADQLISSPPTWLSDEVPLQLRLKLTAFIYHPAETKEALKPSSESVVGTAHLGPVPSILSRGDSNSHIETKWDLRILLQESSTLWSSDFIFRSWS